MDALSVRRSWFVDLLQRVGLLSVETLDAGSDFGTGVAREPGYSALKAMSAYAAFPWVKAVVTAKAVDLSGLPIKLTRGEGPDAEVIPDHEVLDLIARPSERVNGLLYRRQQWVDLDLTGNAYALMLGPNRPTSLLRMHPNRVSIQSLSDGQIDSYQYDQRGGSTAYDWTTVLHVRGPSWEDSPTGLFGTGLIRALHNDLSADLAASQTAATAASKGRPDAIIRPKDGSDRWTPDQVRLIKDSVDRKLKDSEGGALILGGSAEYTPLSWTPKDMEFDSLRSHVREAVLAAAGVPPSRVSLPTANYAQAKEMERTYWQSLQGESALLDAEWTRLAQLWDPRFRIRHDFSAVPSLQEDRTARVQRVQQWWTMGISLTEAAAYEGFDDLPIPETTSRPASSANTDEAAAGPEQQAFGSWWRRAPSLELVEDRELPDPAPSRDLIWRRFIDRIHAPTERAMNLEMRRFLRDQGARFADRFGEMMAATASAPGGLRRDLTDADLAAIFKDVDEAKRLGAAVGPLLEEALAGAFAAAMDQLNLEIGAGDDVIRAAEAKLRAELITNVSTTTKAAVSEVIREGLENGSTIKEMQRGIQKSRAFSPPRALTIARTETTRAVNQGTVESYRSAVQEVPDLRMEWLTARDDGDRHPAYPGLDGTVAEVDGVFVYETTNGAVIRSPYPGGSMIPSEDINCRCTVIPVLGDSNG
jgi:HK97 family phage portal protein